MSGLESAINGRLGRRRRFGALWVGGVEKGDGGRWLVVRGVDVYRKLNVFITALFSMQNRT